MTEAPRETTGPDGRAPMGGPAEPETPQHTADPDAARDAALEDSVPYELAVEDGAPLAPQDGDPGAGDQAPELRAPGSA